jgi:hypothetical protein
MIRYKVIEIPKVNGQCEIVLNDLADDGWRVVAMNDYQIILKGDVNEKELLTEDEG